MHGPGRPRELPLDGMPSTRLFREQHEELKRLMESLRPQLNETPLSAMALQSFKTYAHTLREHLAMEDRGIYPRLLAHGAEQVRLMAQIYQAEMGSLGRDFDALARQWDHQAQTAVVAPALIQEVKDMLDRLEQRMDREDHGLYALVDRLE